MSLDFNAPEYQSDGSFCETRFTYILKQKNHWAILKDGKPFLDPGPGYTPVQTVYCGICSTDLARRFLPYPLPQVIGHEVTVKLPDGTLAAVEINASHEARNHNPEKCPFCSIGLGSQCPERITLGINELPGGFAPWLLAPVHSLIPVPKSVSAEAATLTEPFAAALQAIESDPPARSDRVAVLGVRRLGGLLLAALSSYRKFHNLSFQITAVIRHPELEEFCRSLGADEVILNHSDTKSRCSNYFTKVYDTSGTTDGFSDSLLFTSEVVHLKSTTGQAVMGLSHMTDMVVDEFSLMRFSIENLKFRRANDPPEIFSGKRYIWGSPLLPDSAAEIIRRNPEPGQILLTIPPGEALDPAKYTEGSALPRFDMAVVTSLKETDAVIRPVPGKEFSFLRPGGTILLYETDANQPAAGSLEYALLKENKKIRTSRCGNFRRALQLLENSPELVKILEEKFISEILPLSRIEEGFLKAADSRNAIKILIRTNEGPI